MIGLEFTPRDVAATRFAYSPLWEVIASVRALKVPGEHPALRPWVTEVSPRVAPERFAMLWSLVPTTAIPSFVAPPPRVSSPDLDTELAEMRALPFDTVRAELPDAPALRELRDDPARGLRTLADSVRDYWEIALAPYWPRIRTLCDSDILYRARRLAEGGTRRLFADLSPRLSWRGERLLIRHPEVERTDQLGGKGLLLTPSVFAPRVFSLSNNGWQPTLRYPPRGVSTLWISQSGTVPEALAGVLGRGRARILSSLDTPMSTARIALECDFTAPAVSQHLSALRRAGLVHRHRVGRVVLYARSAAAETLLTAAGSSHR